MAQLGVLRLGWSTVYVRRGQDGLLLIDAGPDYEGAWESALAQLAALGADPRDVRDVVITHAHLDHAGLAARWLQVGARIWVGSGDAVALLRGEVGITEARTLARGYLRRQGVPEELLAQRGGPEEREGEDDREGPTKDGLRRGQYDHTAHWPAPLRFPPPVSAQILCDGATLSGLRVRACPGHTPGSVVLLDEQTHVLYTGDHLLPGFTPPPGLLFLDGQRWPALPHWLASLRALLPLGTTRVMPGHGEPFDDLPTAVGRTCAHAEQRARRLLRLLSAGPLTAYELLLRLFPHLPGGLLWFKLAEVIGLLDLLNERSAVRPLAGSPLRYSPA